MTQPKSQKRPPHLHVPEPAARPGEAPDFSAFVVPQAGAAPRPEIDAPSQSLSGDPETIIRVLDDDGKAVGPWAPELSDEAKIKGLKDMMTLRQFDALMVTAQRKGKTSFYIQALGEEAIGCAFQMALQPGDMNFPTYRQQGLLIASGYPIIDMMHQVYSNAKDPLGGRQLPVLYSSKEHGYFTVSGNLGTQYVQAVGWAMGAAIDGSDKIAAGWIGDGSTAESDFFSALVFASTYRPPAVLNIVNNQWAISTSATFAQGLSPSLAARGVGLGLPSLRADGNDYLAVYAVASWAAQRARAGHGPTLVEYVTYRDGAHSTSDDPSAYRPRNEADAWPLGDPIERMKDHLIAQGLWSQDRHTQAEAEIRSALKALQKQAEEVGTLHSGAAPPSSDMFVGVFKDLPAHLVRQMQEADAASEAQP